MGIAPYKTFTFDGESSGDYGVYITGTGVFNAPERSVEMVEIAGRNGSFALDKGKFENIEVTYRVGIVDDSEADFADRVSDFRNWLCSKVGYCRLEDEYNPNEYRMAVYASGVELEHDLLIAGEAEITFNCKPQRWLTSGETATAVADGGTLSNPTLFESEPLLAVKGYGNINFNGYDIDIENAVMGETQVGDSKTTAAINTNSATTVYGIRFAKSLYNNADTITFRNFNFLFQIGIQQVNNASTIESYSSSQTNASFTTTLTKKSNILLELLSVCSSLTFSAGTASTITNAITINYSGKIGGTTPYSKSTIFTLEIEYDTSGATYDWVRVKITPSGSTTYSAPSKQFKTDGVFLDSTVSILGNPTYIDCDIGECYRVDSDGNIITLNTAIDLGSDLPKLVSGTNTINYDNTITSLEVTPRWWKV